VIGTYRDNAKLRGVPFSLSLSELKLLFSGACYYCGDPPSRIRKDSRKYGEFTYNGIDRQDNDQGYVSGNVVSCCTTCNLKKGAMSSAAFLSWVQKVAHHTSTIAKGGKWMKTSLYYKEGSSDKEYHVQIQKANEGYLVMFQYGRRGSTLTSGTKTPKPVTLAKAEAIFEKLVTEKKAKGYTEGEAGTPYVGTPKEDRVSGLLPQLLNPIMEEEVGKYLDDSEWGAQEKIDGKHIMVRAYKDEVAGSNRKGLVVGIPEPVVKALKANKCQGIFDGEMVGDVYHVFDMVKAELSMAELPYLLRHDKLCTSMIIPFPAVRVVPLFQSVTKRALFERLKRDNKEGIVFKRLAAPYKPGRPNSGGDMLKFKFYATASCIVSHWGREGKRSVALEVSKNGEMIRVGNVTVPANQSVPKTGSIVEVRYLYAFEGGSLFQPVLLGVRDDLTIQACGIEQLKYKAEEEA
jgi:bifunctional non-homologous end joining protein LigD